MNEAFSFHGYTTNNQIFCSINGDDICQIDYMSGQQKPIGKTMAAYSELEQTTKEYYDKLVELGVIVPPKDPQEAMAEMQATMKSMAELISSLSKEVKELKKNGSESDTSSSGKAVSRRKSQQSGTGSAVDDAGDGE